MSEAVGEVCANIGVRGRRQREVFGWIAIGIAVVAAAAMIGTAVAWPWGALLFVPLYAGAIGVLQARGKT